MKIPKKLTELINKYDQENLTFAKVTAEDVKTTNFREMNEKDIYKLLKNGVLLPFADAFKYNNFGVLLTGRSGVGKTTTMANLAHNHNIYARDRPTLFKNDKTYVFKDDVKSNNYPFFAPFLFPEEVESSELRYVINICNMKDSFKQCNETEIKNIIDFIMFEAVDMKKTDDAAKLAYELFEGIQFYNVDRNEKRHEIIKKIMSI